MKIWIFFLMILPIVSFSQDLNQHQWKDRVILVLADSYKNSQLTKQLSEFSTKVNDLQERKLVVYRIVPSSYQKGIKKSDIIKNNTLYTKYNSSNEDFKIILIGLDGGAKLESNKVISSSQIFDQIDQMPMRRQELRTKN
ncbi:DUF4174 domain-containing protein [Aquimarina sp. BL5]|uniref:DUF4174 domain-containing protein n=1 Tax=Aquimarina sp. BL5 TaxID=1714860 RepID=UPI000E471FFC|nr:DUF4174 domain-containing protein [Aquimarina sp. BL5]AXT53699.1 DUF4174 domain-containing protein [Aquimarina sp. BL5]RKN01824.1 DUF4174 domain-containing protein [Aquimarina sp. BL5]